MSIWSCKPGKVKPEGNPSSQNFVRKDLPFLFLISKSYCPSKHTSREVLSVKNSTLESQDAHLFTALRYFIQKLQQLPVKIGILHFEGLWGAMENDCSSCVLYSIRLADVVVVYVVRLFCFFGCFIFTMRWFTINYFATYNHYR